MTLSATNATGTGGATLTLTIAAASAVPAITSSSSASGTAGTAFSYQIAATNSPTSYGATGLPSGLAVNSGTGLISGTPAAAGTSTVTLSATNSTGTGTAALTLTIFPTSAFVQAAAVTTSKSASTFSLPFSKATVSGDAILVGFDFAGTTASSVSDSQGNTYTQVGTQLTSPGGARSVVFYAKNIKGGADTVTVKLSASSAYIELYLTEYSGVDPANPIDAQAGSSGNSGSVSSGSATTTVAGDVIYGFCVADSSCTVGSGFAARSTFDNNLNEDKTAGSPGGYTATGSANNGWTMQMVALRPASGLPAPVITSATTASGTVGGAFSYQIAATNSPISFTATGLPAGLTVNTRTGLISGTPTAAGTSTVTLSATNGTGTGNATLTLSVTAGAPAPALTSLSPASAQAGAGAQSLTLNGTNFLSTSVVTYNGVGHAATFINSNTLTIALSAADQATAGAYPVVVTNPGPGGGASNVQYFTVGSTNGGTVSLSSSSLNFGSQPFLVTSAAQTVSLTNNSSAALNIASLVVGGTNAGDFAQRDNCGSSVAAGGNCTISVTFFPRSTATETATITITDNANQSPQTIALTGTGINSSSQFMTLDPTGTYLVNTYTNTPVFCTGDAPQLAATQISNANAVTYFQDRSAKGFNCLWIIVIDNVYSDSSPDNYARAGPVFRCGLHERKLGLLDFHRHPP